MMDENIPLGFECRVPNWRDEIDNAREDCLYADGKSRPYINKLADEIKKIHKTTGKEPNQIYKAFMAKKKYDFPSLGFGYAWNWFRRGAQYSAQLQGKILETNQLRSNASMLGRSSEISSQSTIVNINWGKYLHHLVRTGVIARDCDLLIDKLENMRYFITNNEYYKEITTAMLNEINSETQDWGKIDSLRKDVIIETIIIPHYRNIPYQAYLGELLGEILGNLTTGPNVLSKLSKVVYQKIILKTIGTPFHRRLDFNFVATTNRHSVWRVFDVPKF